MDYYKDSASFRDPSEHVFVAGNSIFRTVMSCAKENYEYVRDNGVIGKLQQKNQIINVFLSRPTSQF